jgi:hypothetical protein
MIFLYCILFRATGESTRDCSPDSEMLFDDMENDLEVEDLSGQPSLNEPKNPDINPNSNRSSLYFNDGHRSIDFVLTWKKLVSDLEKDKNLEIQRSARRAVFESKLEEQGLMLEREIMDDEVTFVKVKWQ